MDVETQQGSAPVRCARAAIGHDGSLGINVAFRSKLVCEETVKAAWCNCS